MKITKRIRTTLITLALLITVGVAALTVYAAYDGASDPIISLSYLNLFKKDEIDPQIEALKAEIKDLYNTLENIQVGSSGGTFDDSLAEYEVKEVHAGDKIIASMATDIMLRSGSAVAIVPATSGGTISDYTAGVGINDAEAIPCDHMLLIPRGDGRGILITSDVAFILVRGSVTIE